MSDDAYVLSPEERASLTALSFEEAVDALESEEPGAIALATEHIRSWSTKAGEALKQGRDYLELLTPSPETPAIEAIAMEMVLESMEEELDDEDA